MADTTHREPPRLQVAHHQASRIDHTGVGEYQVTMSLWGEWTRREGGHDASRHLWEPPAPHVKLAQSALTSAVS